MAISDKLLYLNGTKQAIKDELNKFGADLTENDTFRSYSNVINDIYDKLPKVSGNGSNFSLENAQNGKLDSFGMDGNTEQDSYSGKNLFNIGAVTSVLNGTLGNDGVITSTAGTTENFNVAPYFSQQTLYSGKTYYLSADIRRVSGEGDFGKINDYVGDWQMVTAPTLTNEFQRYVYKLTFNVDRSYYRILFQFRNTNNGVFEIKNIQMSEVDSVYEPYVGGTPSPNPDYPQDVRVVENEQIINVHGENLISKQITSTTKNGVTITNNGNGTYTLNGKATANVSFDIYASDLNLPTGEYVLSGCPSGGSASTYKMAWNVGEVTNNDFGNGSSYNGSANNRSVWITIYNNYQCNNLIFKPMIEKGSSATTYEPYQSKDYEINLGNIELCKIEDYQDVIFKNNQLSEHYDSTLDEDSWYIKKEIGKVVLDGSNDEIWTRSGAATETSFVCALNLQNTGIITKFNTGDYWLCDKFTCGSLGVDYKFRLYNGDDSSGYVFLGLTIPTTLASDTNAFRTWLGNNNVTLYYVLNTPTTTEITDTDLINQLESIETFTGINNFSVSNENNVLPTLNVSRLKELGKLE